MNDAPIFHYYFLKNHVHLAGTINFNSTILFFSFKVRHSIPLGMDNIYLFGEKWHYRIKNFLKE